MPLILEPDRWDRNRLLELLGRQQAGIQGLAAALSGGHVPVKGPEDARVLREFLDAACALGDVVLHDREASVQTIARTLNLQYEAVNVLVAAAPPPPLAERAAAARAAATAKPTGEERRPPATGCHPFAGASPPFHTY